MPDHFSAKAIGDYLAKFDEALKGQKLDGFRAFFCDSYEVDEGTAGEANFTPQFFDEFQRWRGYDLRLHLPALFSKEPSEERSRLLCDYRETISDLLLDNFAKVWRVGGGAEEDGAVSGAWVAGERAGFVCGRGYSGDGRIWKNARRNGELKEQVAMMYASSARTWRGSGWLRRKRARGWTIIF